MSLQAVQCPYLRALTFPMRTAIMLMINGSGECVKRSTEHAHNFEKSLTCREFKPETNLWGQIDRGRPCKSFVYHLGDVLQKKAKSQTFIILKKCMRFCEYRSKRRFIFIHCNKTILVLVKLDFIKANT